MRYDTPELLLVGSAQNLVLDDSHKSDVSCEPDVCVRDNFAQVSRCDPGF
jgi:hypothetical protein